MSDRPIDSTCLTTLINEALKAYTGLSEKPLTPEIIRKIVREELVVIIER